MLYVMGTMKNIGLSTIAEKTGTDRATVSRVLRGLAKKYYISDERAEIIRQAAEELGYRPNFYAQAQASGKFRTIGLLTREHATNWLPPQLFEGIQAVLRARSLELHVCTIMDSDLEDGDVPSVLSHAMVDGLLVLTGPDNLGEAIARQIDEAPFPAVWICADTMEHGVYVANDAAALEAVTYLRELGHTRIEMVAYDSVTGKARSRGYAAAMRDAGLEPRIIAAHQGAVRELVGARLDAPDRPTALLCHSVDLTTHVFTAAAQRGLRIPADLSLMQMGPKSKGREAVTGMYLDERKRGRAAVNMLLEKINNPEKQPRPHIAALELVDADTCGSPSGKRKDGRTEKRKNDRGGFPFGETEGRKDGKTEE